MANPAFSSRSDCPIPYVPEITPSLVLDCEIPPVPDPFFEAPVFPPIIPPITVGCPSIKVNATASKVGASEELTVSATTTTYDPAGDNCFPEINLDILIPFGCADFLTGSAQPSIKLASQASYELQLNKTSKEAPDCEFETGLDITFPGTIPNIVTKKITRLGPTADPTLSFTAVPNWAGGQNKIDINLEIGVPGFSSITTNTNTTGTGDCIDSLTLNYVDNGSFVLDLVKKQCTAVYC